MLSFLDFPDTPYTPKCLQKEPHIIDEACLEDAVGDDKLANDRGENKHLYHHKSHARGCEHISLVLQTQHELLSER